MKPHQIHALRIAAQASAHVARQTSAAKREVSFAGARHLERLGLVVTTGRGVRLTDEGRRVLAEHAEGAK